MLFGRFRLPCQSTRFSRIVSRTEATIEMRSIHRQPTTPPSGRTEGFAGSRSSYRSSLEELRLPAFAKPRLIM